MKLGPSKAKKPRLWQKTQYANLVRYEPSGVYFARFRARGKLIWRSLKTDRITVAQSRLGDVIKAERQVRSMTNAPMSEARVKDAMRIYLERLESRVEVKPSTRSYHRQRIRGLELHCPGMESMVIRFVTEDQCRQWAAALRKGLSASAYNHTVGVVRKLFEIGMECGARYDNPSLVMKRVQERPKQLQLPESSRFGELVTTIERAGSGKSKDCADLVRFLAFSGLRKNEAANVRWRDCDFDRGEIVVHGDPVTGTKGRGDARRVPMIAEMRQLLERLKAARPLDEPDEYVMFVRECQKSMDTATRKMGIPRITHHDLRHLFATKCIESGVDIPTVARWLGHRDGGILAMRTYGHLRNEHSQGMAKKVSFGISDGAPAEKP